MFVSFITCCTGQRSLLSLITLVCVCVLCVRVLCVCVVCVLCVCVVCVLCVCCVCVVCVPSFPLSSPALSFLATSILLLPRAHVASILLLILLSLLLSLSRVIRVLLFLLFCVQSPLLVSTEPLSAYVAFPAAHSPPFHLHEMIDWNGLMVTTHLITYEPSFVFHTLSHIRDG